MGQSDFRFQQSLCPHCGGEASGITEQIYGIVGIQRDDDGGYDYNGHGTKILWDTSEPAQNAGDLYELHCSGCGEMWETSARLGRK